MGAHRFAFASRAVAWGACVTALGCATAGDDGGFNNPDAGKDSTAVDTTIDDTATTTDAGTDTAPTDSGACTPGDVEQRKCGMCGKQLRSCGPTGTWKAWLACEGELVGAECSVGETRVTDCPMCAKQTDTCDTTTCTFTTGTCTGGGECEPGSYEDTTASCLVAGEVRTRVCDTLCKWGSFSGCGLKKGWIKLASPPTTFSGRYMASAVYTGKNTIVWGGYGAYALGPGGTYSYTRADGASYDLASDTWTVLPAAPKIFDTGRYQHGAVYTGTKMILWGGVQATPSQTTQADGAVYDPALKTWTLVATVGNPSARAGFAAVWSTTTNEMLVWGGCTTTTSVSACTAVSANGHAYDPATNKWSTMPAAPTGFSGRYRPAFAWTGTEMVIWGGMTSTGVFAKDGARYDPKTKTWTKFPDPTIDGRYDTANAWSGKELIAWGGYGTLVSAAYVRDDGARYQPGASWTVMSTPGTTLSSPKRFAAQSWFASGRLYVWSGAATSLAVAEGAYYDPTLDKWTTMPSTDAPSSRCRAAVAWTGTEAIVYGGASAATGGTYMSDAYLFRP